MREQVCELCGSKLVEPVEPVAPSSFSTSTSFHVDLNLSYLAVVCASCALSNPDSVCRCCHLNLGCLRRVCGVATAPRPGVTSVVRWVDSIEVPAAATTIGGMGGFFLQGMRWPDYLKRMPRGDHRYLEALRREILRLAVWRPGDWHQDDPEGIPVFSDGTCGMWSLRGWGDLMAAVWSSELDRDFCYVDFYYGDCVKRDAPQQVCRHCEAAKKRRAVTGPRKIPRGRW